MTFQTDLTDIMAKTQFRNINNPDFTLPPYYNKAFIWNRSYSNKYDLTRTLKTEFKVRNFTVDEPYGELLKPILIFKKRKT